MNWNTTLEIVEKFNRNHQSKKLKTMVRKMIKNATEKRFEKIKRELVTCKYFGKLLLQIQTEKRDI